MVRDKREYRGRNERDKRHDWRGRKEDGRDEDMLGGLSSSEGQPAAGFQTGDGLSSTPHSTTPLAVERALRHQGEADALELEESWEWEYVQCARVTTKQFPPCGKLEQL
tara:strand:- start:1026 stop:1352 length:327 start_codon:yes stop_codon:yes gene_type:complete